MAGFKKAPDSQSVDGLFNANTAEMVGWFATTYWPVVLGGVILFVLVFRGYARVAYLCGIAVVLLQVLWFGWFD